MNRFHVIDGAAVILRQKGVFRQADVYRRGVELFAAHRGGFIQLLARDGTSSPDVSWHDLDAGSATTTDVFGRPVLADPA
jgi:hypothetical protein